MRLKQFIVSRRLNSVFKLFFFIDASSRLTSVLSWIWMVFFLVFFICILLWSEFEMEEVIWFFSSFTMHLAYYKVGRGNLLLRCSDLHFPCNFILLSDRGIKNNSFSL